MYDLLKINLDSQYIINESTDNEVVLSNVVMENKMIYLYSWARKLDGDRYYRKIYPTEKLDEIFSNFLAIPGSVLSTLSVLKGGVLTFFIYVPKNRSEFLKNLFLNAKESFPYMGYEILTYFKVSDLLNEDDLKDRFVHIKTNWKMSQYDATNSVMGILQNKMIFTPKVFCSDSSPIVGLVLGKNIKGKSSYRISMELKNSILVEFNAFSRWFKDFYDNIISKNSGPLIYWGSTDGFRNLYNNFLILSSSVNPFLIGLRNHWREQVRRGHKNSIIGLKSIEEIDIDI